MASSNSAIFRHQPVTIERAGTGSGSVVTLTSNNSTPAYMTELRNLAQEWCASITQTYERKATVSGQGNQILCNIQIQEQDLDEVIGDLQNRLNRDTGTGRSMSATAGNGGRGPANQHPGTGEEDIEEVRGT